MSVGVVRACDDLRGRFGSRLSPCFLCPPPSPAPSAKLISSTTSFRECRLHHNDDAEQRVWTACGEYEVHTEARLRRFDGLKLERSATIKPVFSQYEMVVDFDYCIIAAGATSVPFTSWASHCSELVNFVLDVVRKTDGIRR